MDKLAIITVVYENYTILDAYFAALDQQSDKNFHVFVIDLSPSPKKYAYPSFSSTVTDKNKGYAYGINQGIKKAIAEGYKIFCAMNCDVTMKTDFIQNLRLSLTKHPSSVIGGKIYYYPGFEYHKERYMKSDQGKVFWYAGGTIDWNNVYIKHRGVDEVDNGQYNKEEEVSFITGCLIAFDKNVIEKIGYWDEEYFLFYEDADFCERAKKTHVSLYYIPSLILWHKSGQSTNGAASPFQQKYLEKNRIKFGLKYAPWRTKLHLIKNYFFK